METSQVYAPRAIHVWKVMLDWIGFFFQIVRQILSGAVPVLSYIGLHHYSSFSSATQHLQFKPVPLVELHEIRDGSPQPYAADEVTESCDSVQLEKLMVVLDLDETLVSAYEISSVPASLCGQATEAGINWFDLECFSSDKEVEGKQRKINHVTVFERPGLKDFLKQLSEFADLVLFTAGVEGYAKPLVDRIDIENVMSRRLYWPSTVKTQYRDHVKDLSCLSKDLSRLVIVDNNPFSFLLQPVNGIPCVPFSASHPEDAQLMEVVLPLLKQLSLEKDVRPVLYDMFRMPEWFEKQGIPSSQQ